MASGEIESVHGLRAAIAAFFARPDDVVHVSYAESARLPLREVLMEAARRRIAYTERIDEDLERIAGARSHEGVCIALRSRRLPGPSDLDRLLDADHFLGVVLDGVTNPHNVGAIVRSMAHFGAHALVVDEANGPALSPAAMRVAEGGAEHVLSVRAPIERALMRMRSRDVEIVVAERGAPPAPARWPDRVAIVLGSERDGVSSGVRALADRGVSIPGSGRVESLNVSVAAAVLLDRATNRTRE